LIEVPGTVHFRLADRTVDWYADRLAWCRDHPDVVLEMGEVARLDILTGWTWAQQVRHVAKMWTEVLNQ